MAMLYVCGDDRQQRDTRGVNRRWSLPGRPRTPFGGKSAGADRRRAIPGEPRNEYVTPVNGSEVPLTSLR